MLDGTIKVFECSAPEDSKYGSEPYYKVEGKMAGVNTTWISDVRLEPGEHDVKVKVSLYQGKFNLRIASIA